MSLDIWVMPKKEIKARKHKSRKLSEYRLDKLHPHKTVNGVGIVGKLRIGR